MGMGGAGMNNNNMYNPSSFNTGMNNNMGGMNSMNAMNNTNDNMNNMNNIDSMGGA